MRAGPNDCPQIVIISPGDTPLAPYDAAFVTAETTGCCALIALCACGMTNRVIEYEETWPIAPVMLSSAPQLYSVIARFVPR